MGLVRFQRQDKPTGGWIEVHKLEVVNLIKKQHGDEVVVEMLNEMLVHGLEVWVDGSHTTYRCVVEREGPAPASCAGRCGNHACGKAA